MISWKTYLRCRCSRRQITRMYPQLDIAGRRNNICKNKNYNINKNNSCNNRYSSNINSNKINSSNINNINNNNINNILINNNVNNINCKKHTNIVNINRKRSSWMSTSLLSRRWPWWVAGCPSRMKGCLMPLLCNFSILNTTKSSRKTSPCVNIMDYVTSH